MEKRNGKVKEYYDNGRLEFEGEYLNGKRRDGKVKEFYDNGRLYYLNGKKIEKSQKCQIF